MNYSTFSRRAVGCRSMARSLTIPLFLLLLANTIAYAQRMEVAPSRQPAVANSSTSSLLEPAQQTLARHQPVFIENKGQWDKRAKFLLRSPGLDLWITDNGVVYDLNRVERVDRQSDEKGPHLAGAARMDEHMGRDVPELRISRTPVFITFEGASREAVAVGSGKLQQYHNYYIGSDRSKWVGHVPLYSDARVQGLYNGIDAVFYLDQGRPRYDLMVAVGANPANIRMKVEGATKVSVGKNGELRIATTLGIVEQRELFAYQEVDGRKQKVSCAFVATGSGNVRLKVGGYDRSRPLVIDPIIYSTYLSGSSADQGNGIAVDGNGNAYVTGWTESTNFPTANAMQGSHAGGGYLFHDVFVTKLTSSGTLSYSTYLGGVSDDEGYGIAVDTGGNAYVTGMTVSGDFPTLNPAQGSLTNSISEVFVTKLTSSGALSYSTYLGGAGHEYGYAIAVDGSGNAYVTGWTFQGVLPPNFPILNATHVSAGGFHDAFVTKLTSSGALSYSTYLGGSLEDMGTGIAVDGSGNVYVTGWTRSTNGTTNFPTLNAAQGTGGSQMDAFVTKLTSSCALSYSTFLGGSTDDRGWGIAVDVNGNAYVTGITGSPNFPTLNAMQGSKGSTVESDAFVTKLTSSGALSYSTYLGGSSDDQGNAIAVDGSSNAYITGWAWSTNFPTLNAVQGSNAGNYDPFVTKLTSSGTLSFSTYLGGSGGEEGKGIGVDGNGNAYIAGWTNSANFPTVNAMQGSKAGFDDAFVTKLSPSNSITSASLNGSSPYCVGSSVTINWVSSGVSIVNIDFSTDDGTNWTSIATGQTSGTTGGSYGLTIPNSPGSNRRVRVSDAESSSVAAISSSFTINALPVVTTNPASNSPVCPGTSVTFTVAAGGTPTPTVQWQRRTDSTGTFSDISGATSASLVISSPTLPMNGYQYRAVFTNSCSTAITATATLRVEDNSAPVPDNSTLSTITGTCSATITSAPTATDACVGSVTGTTTDPLIYTAAGTYTVQWTYDDGNGNTATQEQSVMVGDDEAPTLTFAAGTTLWPPNHNFSYVTFDLDSIITEVGDNCATGLSASDAVIWKVTSDELEDADGYGDGNTEDDITIADDCRSVQLRAERSGNGNGRVYRVYVRIDDGNGNTSSEEAWYAVSVPHSNNGTAAVDDDVVNYQETCGGLSKSIAGLETMRSLLLQNHPNPFSSMTSIVYTVPAAAHISVVVYDANGQLVATIVDAHRSSGTHTAIFNGSGLASGTYTYVLSSNGLVLARTMVLLR